ncbi:MAG: bifunctional glutamate--cysteine ligase GshA/glutathione synthetase GshB [Clostridiales bacterium]|uniref:bifunctional glutamate--cysteine ligase GshA/glutathione synthetase GshB n=1 Tax=Zhenhengia sp. TaxID=2944208 RepID=UPI0029106F11|nr:bifunctional glutamate--cysteine ligase GshA/glutathione synthetase GshB [Clostridiales bacterium]
MLEKIKSLLTREDLLGGHFGIEREGLRCEISGKLALTPHPEVFGEKLRNPYITTDFSESQLELITPAMDTLEQTYDFLSELYDIAVMEIGDEYIWPQSMPCIIPEDKKIPIARFCKCPPGVDAESYRQKLMLKYGGKKQLVSGIHYNFSFKESLIQKLHTAYAPQLDTKSFKNSLYLKVTRNYLRYRWLIIYLLGSTSTMHETYVEACGKQLKKISSDSFSSDGALSYRNGDCGYQNKTAIFPNYDSVGEHIASLERFIQEGTIESHKELYSQIRLKAKDNGNLLESLQKDGICYLEYRSIDINPFDRAGISLNDLYFMQLFNLYLLFKEESDYTLWQEEALENQKAIATHGQKELQLKKDGNLVLKEDWGMEMLQEMRKLNDTLGLDKQDVIEIMEKRLKDYQLTYAYQLVEVVKREGYVAACLNLAKQYKDEAYKARFIFKGYEDMELSTQMLLKEAVKRGITIELLDRADNFVALKKYGETEYVKQATKTTKDNYISVLLMENKVVTKKILKDKGINVPMGGEWYQLEDALCHLSDLKNKPIVIKPKSTNFGKGISIFPEGTKEEDLESAFKEAFKHDNTVLVEEFIKGKEYRFLVIGEEVVGILHRVPANVVGDGVHTIKELVSLKNQDPLRGKGYRRPLEKIHLDETARLFLKAQGLDFESIPEEGRCIYLRENSNISTGGDSIDYTDLICDHFKQLAVEASHAVGAKICGVDMMIENVADSKSSYAVIELNFNPAIHIHSYPYKGKERNIAHKILKLLGFLEKRPC